MQRDEAPTLGHAVILVCVVGKEPSTRCHRRATAPALSRTRSTHLQVYLRVVPLHNREGYLPVLADADSCTAESADPREAAQRGGATRGNL